jgi:predicted aspartyl protease
VYADDRPASPYLAVENKVTGDRIEIDGKTAGIAVEAKAALKLKAIGVVSIEGLQVVINGRVVGPGPDPI